MRLRDYLWGIQWSLQFCAQLGSANSPKMEPAIFFSDVPEELQSWQVLPRNPDAADTQDSIIAHANKGHIYVSQNLGINWTKVHGIESAKLVQFSPQDSDKVFVYSTKGSSSDLTAAHISFDRGFNFKPLVLPDKLDIYQESRYADHAFEVDHAFYDHPVHKNWLIFNNGKKSYYSKDHGDTWHILMDNVLECRFVAVNPLHYKELSENKVVYFAPDLIHCIQYNDKTHAKDVYYSQEFFTDAPHKRLEGFGDLQSIEQHGNYVITVSYSNDKVKERIVGISSDGIHFHRAQFPTSISQPNSDVRVRSSSEALMLIEGSEQSLLHAGKEDYEFTPVLNGITNPFLDLSHYIDNYREKYKFIRNIYGQNVKRIPSVNGVLLTSTISNFHEFEHKQRFPKYRSHISHDGGATWQHVKSPKGGDLFLADYDHSDDFLAPKSLENAVGMYITYGNEQIMDPESGLSTYMTRDAGHSWFKIHDNKQLHAIGDHGSIIVLVNREIQTDHIQYSLDEGVTWKKYSWGYKAVAKSVVASPGISTGRFVLLLHDLDHKKDIFLVLDFFTGDRPFCTSEDFETWTPSLSSEEGGPENKCILGKELGYLRRVRDRECFIGAFFKVTNTKPFGIIKSCDCTRKDYECSITHELDPGTNECVPQKGVHILSQEDQCKDGALSWRNVTGYRKIASTTCEGEFLAVDKWLACPGKDEQFKNQQPVAGLQSPLNPFFKRSSTSLSPLLTVVVVALSLLGGGILVLLIIFRHSIIRSLRKLKFRLPFIGSRDSLGSYSRMGNEERTRALDDGDEFEIDDDIELDDMIEEN